MMPCFVRLLTLVTFFHGFNSLCVWKVTKNSIGAGSPYNVSVALSDADCMSQCENVTGCKSVDWSPLTHACRIYSAATPSILQINNLWNNYAFSCDDPCRAKPCQNGGSCAPDNSTDGFRCTCPEQYIGDRCENKVVDCQPDPCFNGGDCSVDDSPRGFYCQCSGGFYGDRCENQHCPEGFVYRAATGSCYYLSLDRANWETARDSCSQLHPGAYLVLVNSQEEFDDSRSYFYSMRKSISEETCGEGIWTSGHVAGDTCSPWTWQPTSNDTFAMTLVTAQWARDEPNCDDQNNLEQCMEYFIRKGYYLNDANCRRKGCYVCEYGPYFN